MKKINEILLRRKNKIIFDSIKIDEEENNGKYVATIMKNFESLGYLFSQELIEKLTHSTLKVIESFYFSTLEVVKENIGYKNYNPMYPNFPQQVMDSSFSELYINAIIHYFTLGELLPSYEKDERLPLFDEIKYKTLDIATEKDIENLFYNLINSKTSLSGTDKQDLIYLMEEYKFELPREIPFKENVAIISKILIEDDKFIDASKYLNIYLKTATDILRTITAMSYGDISLATNTIYCSFKRKERRLLLSLLNTCENLEEDMNRHKEKWVKVGEKLHPFEYKQFQKVNNVFNKIRNSIKIETFNGKIDRFIKNEDYTAILITLLERPGEFARRLDYLLRIIPNKNMVINNFKTIANKVSTPVLLQVKAHFESRNKSLPNRIFFPKGSLAKAYTIENNLLNIENYIEENYCKNIIDICNEALISQYKEREYMGKIYLSDEYKNYLVPFSQRSASKALKTIVRGSKLSIEDNVKFIRPFIWWKQPITERVDIDLSAIIYDDKWNSLEGIAYTNLKSEEFNCCHSGDITNAPDGASEFIDIDIDKIINNGGRYVTFSIHSYTNQKYCDLPECFFGFMNREDSKSGEIYEPKTVKNKIDLTSDTQICIPVVFDLLERKMIWLDLSCKKDILHVNNMESNKITISKIVSAMVDVNKPNLYDLIYLNGKARGNFVNNKEDADIIFDIEDGITPFDTEIFMGKYL